MKPAALIFSLVLFTALPGWSAPICGCQSVNEKAPVPGFTPTGFEIELSGIHTLQPLSNGFYRSPFGPGPDGSAPVVTNDGTNTFITFSSTPYNPSEPDFPHFGYSILDALGPSPAHEQDSSLTIEKLWLGSAGAQLVVPEVQVHLDAFGGTTTSSVQFLTFLVDLNGLARYFEFEVPADFTGFQLAETNPTNGSLSLTDAGYIISPTEIPLDQLNPTDTPYSGATPLLALDGSLRPGSTFSTPEPSSFSLAALGALAALFLRSPKPSWHRFRERRGQSLQPLKSPRPF